ncbi:hypothetical protein SDJN02_01899, partial [Cucurbita argyrosperma subsp. argyrosperma]
MGPDNVWFINIKELKKGGSSEPISISTERAPESLIIFQFFHHKLLLLAPSDSKSCSFQNPTSHFP